MFPLQCLENGGMFRIHRQDGGVVFPGSLHYYFACSHQRLLIGYGHGLAGAKGGQCRFKAAETHHGRQHQVYIFACSHGVYDRIHAGKYIDAVRGQGFVHFLVQVLVGDDDAGCIEFDGLLDEQEAVVGRSQQLYVE